MFNLYEPAYRDSLIRGFAVRHTYSIAERVGLRPEKTHLRARIFWLGIKRY